MYFVHEGGADYPFVVRRLTALFEEQGVFPPEGALENRPVPVRAVGLIFGRPTCRVFKDELLPDQAYYNLRSDKNMELFYMGYAPSKEQPFKRQFDEHDFDNQSFVGAVGDFEHRTKWSYSGETDLILQPGRGSIPRLQQRARPEPRAGRGHQADCERQGLPRGDHAAIERTAGAGCGHSIERYPGIAKRTHDLLFVDRRPPEAQAGRSRQPLPQLCS
jgi:hypothetical protein